MWKLTHVEVVAVSKKHQNVFREPPHCKFAQKKQNLTKMLDAPAKFEVIN
jgi:hypothetical protein